MNIECTQIVDSTSVLADLKSTDPQILRNAAFVAADMHLDESVELLCALIFNDNVGVQEAAEFALRKLRGINTVRCLTPYLRSDDTTVRNIAMDILREIGIDDTRHLKKFMHDEDANIRIYIADILGCTGSRTVVNTLGNALINDADVNVRHYAAISLGWLAFPECTSLLAKAMQDEEWVQFAVVESLSKIHDKSTIDVLIKALPISTKLVASTIINALGEIGNIKTIPLLFKSLETASTPLRRKAVKAIIQILGEKSLPLLSAKDRDRLKDYCLDALNDENIDIKIAALSGLAVVGDAKITNTILNFALEFKHDGENVMRDAAIHCLATIGYNDSYIKNLNTSNERLLRLLIEISTIINNRKCIEEIKKLFWTKNAEIQRLIIERLSKIAEREDIDFFTNILAKHNDPNIIKGTISFLGAYTECSKCADEIFKMLHHPYDDIKEVALNACINIATPCVKLKFKELFHDADPTQRLMAVYALYNFNTENIAEEVKQALKDENSKIRQLALQCLGFNVKDLKDNLPELLACINDEDSTVRTVVIELIGKSDDPIIIPYLINALKDENEWVKIRVVEALGEVKDPTTVPKIVQMLENTTQMLTFTIISALGKIGGKIAFNALLNMMGQEDKEIQNALENAISAIRGNRE